jgi:hypothetical protein
MLIAVLVTLYRSHLGNDSEPISLSRWIRALGRPRYKLWNGTKQLVKDFHQSQELFDIVLDGYILANFAQRAGFGTVHELKNNFASLTDAQIAQIIEDLSWDLIDVKKVYQHRIHEEQDQANDNMLLYMQHGMVLRNFRLAMRQGDPGRVFVSLRFFTVWFQCTKQHNYARETMHLTAMMKKVWSSRLVEFYKQNMLLNLSGKAEGWIPCDQVNEDEVKEYKSWMDGKSTPAIENHVRNVNTLLIFPFRAIRRRIAQECDAYTFDFHSQPVDPLSDITSIANKLLAENLCVRNTSRAAENTSEVPDLFVNGQQVLATTQSISDYKKDVQKMGYSVREFAPDMDEENDEAEDEENDEANALISDDEEIWLEEQEEEEMEERDIR